MDKLLATTLRAMMRRQDWNQYSPIVTASMFPNATAATLYHQIMQLHKHSKRSISIDRLDTALNAALPAKRYTKVVEALEDLKEVTRDDLDDADYAIRTYASRHLSNKAARYIASRMGSPDFDYDIPARYCADAKIIAQGQLLQRVEVRDAGLPGDVGMVREPVSLGLSPELDVSLGGGIAAGELLLFLAPPKRGKTSFLYNVCHHFVAMGEGVLAYTLEIARYKAWLRFYQAMMGGMLATELIERREQVAAKREKLKGKIWIHDYCGRPLTPSQILAEGEIMQGEGLPLSAIMVDYMEIMKGDNYRHKPKHEALGELVIDMRRVANTLDCKMVSAWQIKRDGAEKDTFGVSDISECWDAVKHADIIIGLNQSDHERINMTMRLKVMEQRESTARPTIWVHCDLDRLIVRPIHTEADDYGKSDTEKLVDSRSGPRPALHGYSSDT